ncbi:MAG: TonB-dependent receptor [Rhodothermales bacterium]
MLLFAAVGTAAAQAGKIQGQVFDSATGETMPGVNVFIEGTTQGASTDLDGKYTIIGVRPGVYTVLASFVGFSTQRQEGVQVSIDLTTTVNFRLTEEVFQGEEVVITADAVTVAKDLTSSEARVNSATLDRLPVTELGQVLEVQAGITNRDGLHIRGGRSSEVVYMVDGVPVTDSYDGSAAIQLENDGIEELQVISGTFNAEFGNAMSGVINVVSKEGRGDRIGGSVKAYTGSYVVTGEGGADYLRGTNVDKYTKAGIQYRDVDPYSYLDLNPTQFYNTTISLEGPITSDRFTFFALGRFFRNTGWIYGAQLYDVNGMGGDSSLVSMNDYEKTSWQGSLKYRLSSKVILNLSGLGSFSTGDANSSLFYRWNPEGVPTFTDYGYDARLKLTHLLSPTTFYAINVATFYRKAQSRLYDDPFDSRYNGFLSNLPDSIEVSPGVYEQVLSGGSRYSRIGTDPGRFQRSTQSFLVKGELSSQIGDHHLVKTGFEGKVDNLDFTAYSLIAGTDETGAIADPYVPSIPQETSSSYNNFDNVSPISGTFFVQDKIEYESVVINAGLRVDYFDSRADVPADPDDPNIYNPLKKINRFFDTNGDGIITADEETAGNEKTVADREGYWYTSAKPKTQVSPRLGVAYPITEEGVIHFSYGLFFQIPTLNNLFDNFGYKIPNLSGSYGPFGNPDLKAQKTTMYEIGFKQGFGPIVIDVTGYYRDVRNWISTSPLITTAQPGVNYVIYANRDYANTRGLTLSLRRNFEDHYGFDASYTFQVVEGSNSNPADEFFASQSNSQPTLALLPLNWDQRHKVAGAFYVGGSSWGGSTRFRFESGFPYTPTFLQAANSGNDVQPEFPSNSRRMPAKYEFDITAYKEFRLAGVTPRLFVEVYNLFDRRNVVNVFSDTGEPDVTLFQLQTSAFDPGYYVRPGNYSEPRRIQVGVEFKF